MVHDAAAEKRSSAKDATGRPIREERETAIQAKDRLRFQTFASEVRARVEDNLRKVFAAKLKQLAPLGKATLALGQAVQELTMRGGKRLRAVLLAAGYLAVDSTADLEPAISAGTAFELLQSYFLIHDDIIDGDTIRRGGDTVHVMLARDLGGSQVGNAAAILAGDYAMALAQEVMASTNADERAVLASVVRLAQVQIQTIEGQLLDMTTTERGVDDYRLEDLKTGSYTVRGPLLIGATLAGARPALLEACVQYAGPLGVAFQMRDDLLGLLGDVTKTGKPIGTDLRGGKMTHVLMDALQRLRPEDRAALRGAMGNSVAGADEIGRAVELVVRSGAVARMEARIAELSSAAVQHLKPEAGFSEASIVYLRCLAERMTARET